MKSSENFSCWRIDFSIDAQALADLHLAFDAAFVFGFEQAHEFLEEILTTKLRRHEGNLTDRSAV